MNEIDYKAKWQREKQLTRLGFFRGKIKPDRYEFIRGIRRGMKEFEIKGDEDDE